MHVHVAVPYRHKVHAADASASARFANCELRTLCLTWTGSGDARVFELCSVE